MRSVEHIFEQLTGIDPKKCEPPLTELYMTEVISEKRSKKRNEAPRQNSPIYILLACESLTDDPIKIDAHYSLIGKRNTDGQWTCAIIGERIDPQDVDNVVNSIDPKSWRNVNEVPGLGEHIQYCYDPDFKPAPATPETMLRQAETLWRRSIDNGTTKQDVFKTDDVIL